MFLDLAGFFLELILLGQGLNRELWDRFPIGSRVVYSLQTSEGLRKESWKETLHLEALAEGRKAPVRTDLRDNSTFFVALREQTLSQYLKDHVEESREKADLQIKGKTVACTRTVFVQNRKKVTVWGTKDVGVPERNSFWAVHTSSNIVQVELRDEAGERLDTLRESIIDTDAAVKVGMKEYSCAVEEVVSETKGSTHDQRTETRRWLSREVPGHVLREETTLVRSDGTTHRSIREAIEVHVPR
jgi:hypothetical protein